VTSGDKSDETSDVAEQGSLKEPVAGDKLVADHDSHEYHVHNCNSIPDWSASEKIRERLNEPRV